MHINKKKGLLYLFILLAIAGAGYSYFRPKDEMMYITEPVEIKDVRKVVNATGEIKAIELVTVGAQVSGKIEKLYAVVGQVVKKGDMIAQIDSTTQQNDVDSTRAKLKSYNAQLAAAKVSERIALKQYERMKSLRKQDAASEEELEDAQNTYETAQATVTELEVSIEETEIALNTAETNLGYTKITAPLDGTIVSVPVKVGQTVNAAMDTPTIVQIADLTQMEILIEISEGDIANVQPGQKVTYSTLADLTHEYETTLKSIDPGLTLLTNGEYTEVVDDSEAIYYYGRLVVPNPEGKLRIGMTTQNVIYVAQATDVLTVPSIAVKDSKDAYYVQVLTETGVQQRPVVTGISDGLNVEIKSGRQITEYYQIRYDNGKSEFKDLLEAIYTENAMRENLIQQKYQIIKYENYIYKAMNGRYKKV